MTIKFVGSKASISHRGITFSDNKEDKYLYLNIALQLIQALDHEYIADKVYRYEPDTKRLSDSEIVQALSSYCDNLKTLIDDAAAKADAYVNDQITHAQVNRTLNSDERHVLEKNYEMMRHYIVQRHVNKTVYYCAVGVLADIMRRGHIDSVAAPMYERFLHVFHSVEGVLHRHKRPIDTKIDIYEVDGQLFAKLALFHR